MSLVSEAFIFEKYGIRLGAEQIADVMGVSKATLYNQITNGTCKLRTYMDGGKRWADYRDVATYFDTLRESASAPSTVS